MACGLVAISSFFSSCTKTKVEILNSPAVNEASTRKPVVKVFLENSGSMDGFMCDGSELKDGIYNYLTSVKDNASKMELYYINSAVLKQNVTLSEYIRNLNPQAFKKAGGNRAFTDIPSLFRSVLSTIDENTVAVYISDCILDIPNHAAPNYLNITRTDIHSAFGDKIAKMPNLSVCIYQLTSTFNGTFFFPKGGSTSYQGKLPYYMLVMGTSQNLANIRKNVPETEITHGVRNYCAFAPAFDVPATLLQGIKPVQAVELNTKRDGKYHFKVEVNLDQSLQEDKVLTNPNNYLLSNPAKIMIDNISPILVQESEYSHILEFSIADEAFGNVVSMKRVAMPSWVKNSNDARGDSISPNKTFGVEQIIGGISDAFKSKTMSTIKINIKKQ